MKPADPLMDYVGLASEYGASTANWLSFVRDVLVDRWLIAYRDGTPWDVEAREIEQGTLTYLFDAGPTAQGADAGQDRVVAVWGHSRLATTARDRRRQRGFVPNPPTWSEAGHDRGHFVAHAAGGGMDMNLFPQAAGLNRGSSPRGKVWRAMERYTVEHPGTALFVRPGYDGVTWVPATIDYGVLTAPGLWCERFENRELHIDRNTVSVVRPNDRGAPRVFIAGAQAGDAMSQQGRQPEDSAPRGPFDHPKLRDIVRKEVDVSPGWDEREPDRPHADRAEDLPPRGAQDVPREPLSERGSRRPREY